MRESTPSKYILISLFLILLPALAWSAEFEVARGSEDVPSEQSDYDEDFDSVFDDPAEDIVVEQPSDIDYRNQFEESKKIIVKGDFVMRAGGGLGWPEKIEGKPEKVAGAYSKAYISFDARPDPTIRIFGKLKTEMNSDNGSDVWSMLDFDELYCDYNWLDKSYFRLGKFYMTWGQGRLFRPANFMEDAEDGTALRVTLPNVLDGVSLVTLYKKRTLDYTNEKRLHKGDLSYAGHVDKTLGPINFSVAMLYNDLDGQRYSGSVKTVILHTDLFADYVLNRSDEGDITHEALAGFFKEWENAKLYGEYYYNGRNEDNISHCVGLATDFNNLFGTPIGMGFKWLHSFTGNTGQFIGGFSVSPWKHVKIRMAIPWQYGDKELDKDFYEEFPISNKLAFTLFVELSAGF